jgi:hypothetical protein
MVARSKSHCVWAEGRNSWVGFIGSKNVVGVADDVLGADLGWEGLAGEEPVGDGGALAPLADADGLDVQLILGAKESGVADVRGAWRTISA